MTWWLIVVLLVAIILHEVAHGVVALWLGDPTAKNQGRLTVNPIAHIDPIGSLLLPGLSIVSGSSVFIGWAKPVPVQPHYFKKPEQGMMLVALAGPVLNLALAAVGIFLFQTVPTEYTWIWVQVNITLACFNLFPIPPLDGSKVLMYFLPDRAKNLVVRLEPYGFLVIFLLAYFGFFSHVLGSILSFMLRWMVGL